MGLSLKLLGDFAVGDEGGNALSLPTRKTRALLAYLAVNADKPQQRERLMTLLWSDRGEQQARHSLNQALMSIRRLGNAAGVPLLDGDGERVTLLGDAIAIDVADFRDRLANDPEGAAALYEGPFLDGLTIPDPAFEEWQAATRSELYDSACDALSRAADQAMQTGDPATATEILRRLVALDPLREDAHRRLMKALYEGGDRAGALRQYQVCADVLKKELQVEPDAATKVLFEEIRDDKLTSSRSNLSANDAGSPLAQKPSIAVLPFANLSGDPEQEYFSDGISEDILTDLSKFDWLAVIARNSSFAFKGQSIDTKSIATELNADFIVEGSVRKAGNRVRISVQLVDAHDGVDIWAERYDRELDDIFKLQDEITQYITSAIGPELEHREIRRALGERPENLTAWDYLLRARSVLGSYDRKSFAAGRKLLERALEQDPAYTDAMGALAMVLALSASMGWTASVSEAARESLKLSNKAIQDNPRNIRALCARGIARSVLGDVEEAVGSLRQAIQLTPNFSFPRRILARLLCFRGDYAGAKAEAELALALSPRDTLLSYTLFTLGFVGFAARDYDEAITWSMKVVQDYPSFNPSYLVLAAARAESGDIDGAKDIIRQLLSLDPEASCERFLSTFPATNHPLAERYKTALASAGLRD